ncbi:udp-galactose transporter-like protein, partial [Thalassiosira pseudonana CCMP1335]
KYLVLILLVVQNTCLVLLMRYSRTRPGTMYLGSTAVCCDEAMKLVTCLMILTDDTSKTFLQYFQDELQFDFRMGGLALLYTVQKNLLYLAISNVDAAVFQVTYQAKILTTALFSVLLLGKKLSYQKIAGLLLLTLGVALVQLDKVEENASKSYQEQRRWVGVLAVLGACCTSGFGGVYFELVLKPQNGDTPPRPPPSVWAKNVQLSTFALVIALVTAFLKDHTAILRDGFFQGYSPLVVLVITLEAGGGLVVAAVIKYADNILKSFATAASIVTSTIVSMLVFGFLISKLFIGGSLLVFVAIWMYSKSDESAG